MYKFGVSLLSSLLAIVAIYGMDDAKKPSSSTSIHMEGRYEKTTTNISGSSWTTTYTYPNGSSSKYQGKSE